MNYELVIGSIYFLLPFIILGFRGAVPSSYLIVFASYPLTALFLIFLFIQAYGGTIFIDTPVLLLSFIPYIIAFIVPRVKKVDAGKTSNSKISTKAGKKDNCEKCGSKTRLNYGDAYLTLCENCA